MTEEDSKYLAEKMGLRYTLAGIVSFNELGDCVDVDIDFSSEHGFFVAFEWLIKEELLEDFMFYLWCKLGHAVPHHMRYACPNKFIGPRFGEELVTFLRGREK